MGEGIGEAMANKDINTAKVGSLGYDVLIPMMMKQIENGRTVILPLQGYSMRPYLEDGRDKALMGALPQTLKIGDVILARLVTRNSYALHRITNIDGDIITMCGDGNMLPEVINRQDVLAIAKGFYRKGKQEIDSVDTSGYRFYWKAWVMLKPIRRYLLYIWRMFNGKL